MAQQLMAHVRLGRVERLRMMADILRGMEDPEGKPIEEISRREQSHHRSQREAGAFLKEIGDILQLRDLVGTVPTVLL